MCANFYKNTGEINRLVGFWQD